MIENSGLFILIVSCLVILIAGYKLISLDASSILIANRLIINKNRFSTLVVSCIAIFIVGYNLFSYNNTFILLSLLIPIAHLADCKGHKRVFCIGACGYALLLLLLFALSFNKSFGHAWTSFLQYRGNAPLSPLFFYLVLAIRGLQDLFLTMLIPTSMALLINAFPQKQRGMSLGLYFGVLGVSQLSSTPITIIIAAYLTTRGYYLTYIVLASSAALLCYYGVNALPQQRQRIDWSGSILIICCLACFYIAITISAFAEQWTTTSLLYGLASIIFLLLFIAVENQVKQPLLPESIFKNRELLVAIIVYNCGTMIAYFLILLPILFVSLFGLLTKLLLAIPLLIITPILIGYFCNRKNRMVAIHISFVLCLFSFVIIVLMFSKIGDNPNLNSISHILYNLPLVITWIVCSTVSLSLVFSNSNNHHHPAFYSSIIIACGIIFAQIVFLIATYLFKHYASTDHSVIVKLYIAVSIISLLILAAAWSACCLLIKKCPDR